MAAIFFVCVPACTWRRLAVDVANVALTVTGFVADVADVAEVANVAFVAEVANVADVAFVADVVFVADVADVARIVNAVAVLPFVTCGGVCMT
jgi:hypothetical protein